jgi:hypothetical protein
MRVIAETQLNELGKRITERWDDFSALGLQESAFALDKRNGRRTEVRNLAIANRALDIDAKLRIAEVST